MIIDSEIYITTPISQYLSNMLDTVGYQSISLQMRPMIIYALSNTFLSMFGAIEKKIEMISWHIAHDDYDYRHDLLRKNRSITADLNAVDTVYKNLVSASGSGSIFTIKKYYNKSYEIIIDLFKDSIFINYTNSEFLEFKNNYQQLNKNELEKLYKNSLQHRHTIAHNINSIYRENPTFSELNRNAISYNWYAKFMILLFVDCALMDGFDYYNKRLSKIKWN